jgi:hypothetical protein
LRHCGNSIVISSKITEIVSFVSTELFNLP